MSRQECKRPTPPSANITYNDALVGWVNATAYAVCVETKFDDFVSIMKKLAGA